MDLTLKKVENSWWPRLTSQPQKPVWLKIDFDRWVSEEDLADEDVRDVREDYPDLYKKLQQEEIGYMKGEVVYNNYFQFQNYSNAEECLVY